MKRFSFDSLRVKLIFLVLIAILPLFGLTIYVCLRERAYLRERALQDALNLARNISAAQDDMIRNARYILFFVSQMMEEHEHKPETFRRMFVRFSPQAQELTALAIFKPDGKVVASTSTAANKVTINDRPYYQRLMQTKDFVIGEYQIGRVTGKPVLPLAYPVLDDKGQVRHIIITGIDLSHINSSIKKSGFPSNIHINIFDHNGTVLLRYPHPGNFVGKSMPNTAVMKAALNKKEGVIEAPGLDGVTRLFGLTSFGQPAGTVYVSVGIPVDVALAHADRVTFHYLIWLIVIAGLALILAWLGGDIFILRSLNRLVGAATLVESGDLSARVGSPYGKGEIAQLSHAFDQMGEALQQREAEKKQAEETLRQSEMRYRSLVETSPDAVVLIDANANILMVNRQGILLSGYETAEEIVGRSFTDFLPVEERALVAENFKKTLEMGGIGNIEHTLQKKDGATFPAELSFSVIFDEVGNPVATIYVIRDITERKKAEETLKASERKYRELIDTLQEGIWAIDKDGVTTFVNDAMSEMLGYTRDEMRGKYLFTFMDERAVEIAKKYIERRKEGIKKLHDFEFIRKDGIRISTTLTTSPIFDDQGNYAGAVAGVMDISERKQKEAQIEVNLKRMTALRDIDMAITGSLDLRVTLNVILDQVTTLLNVDAAVVLLLDQHSLVLEYGAGRGLHTSALQHTTLRLGEGLAGRSALERRIIAVNIPDEAGYLEQSPLLVKEGFQTYFAVPLIAKGHVKGVLEAFHRKPLTPNQEWLDFLDAMAGQAAIAIDNASLFNDLERSNIYLLLAYDSTLEGWSRALDMRDKETEGHSQRVTALTVRLAKALGIGNDEITHMRRGAMLHDIGKMGVPDNILLKPGPLTDAEWEIMRQHPVLAYEMLQPIDFLRLAREIPANHHEKWDGTGYPRGLKGEGIPLAARIFAVVDVWDALSSERPYRPAWSQEKVLEYIREQAGQHFDPKVVEVFLDLMRGDGAYILLEK